MNATEINVWTTVRSNDRNSLSRVLPLWITRRLCVRQVIFVHALDYFKKYGFFFEILISVELNFRNNIELRNIIHSSEM